jgi:hypothetical protein
VTPIQCAIKRVNEELAAQGAPPAFIVTEHGTQILTPADEIETAPPATPQPKPPRQVNALVRDIRKHEAESAAIRSTLTLADFPPLPLVRVKELADPARNGPIVVSLALEVEFLRARAESLSLQLEDELVFRQRAQKMIATGGTI